MAGGSCYQDGNRRRECPCAGLEGPFFGFYLIPLQVVRVAPERHKKGRTGKGSRYAQQRRKGNTHEKANSEDRNIIIRLIIFVNKGLLTRIS